MQKFLHIQLNGIDSYLDNVLAMPVILSLLLAERRVLFKRSGNYTLPVWEIVLATAYIALITEVVFPMVSSRFTADWLDIVFYSAGSFLFNITLNHPSGKNSESENKTTNS